MGEEEVDVLGGLAIEHGRLLGADGLPGFDGLAEERIDGLGEGGARLVGGDIEQADRVTCQGLAGVAGDRHAVVLPADATDAEPGDLVTALTGKEPGQRDGPDQLDRVGRGDKITARLVFRGHFTGTFGKVKGKGQAVEFNAIDIQHVGDDRITEDWHIEDNQTLLGQLGIATAS